MNFVGRQLIRIFKSEVVNNSHVCSLGRNYSFKSAYSLENLYPQSNIKLYSPKFEPEDPNAKFNGFIPIRELDVTYSRSSGPGGQNVNTVNTKVDLRFNVQKATWIADDVKPKLIEQEKNRINKEGYLIVKSDVTRSQQLNLADALEKLRSLIRKAVAPKPQITPETEEVLRKRHMKAARERLYEKRSKSQIKQYRQMGNVDLD